MFEWNWLPSPYKDFELQGAVVPPFQYAVGHDKKHGAYSASVKEYPNASKMQILGSFQSEEEAKASCIAHHRNNVQ